MSCMTEVKRDDASATVETAVRSTLLKYDAQPIVFDANVDIRHEGDRAEHVYLIKSGWLYSYGVLADGQRQILYLHKAGDMAGFADLGGTQAVCALRSLTECVVYPIPVGAFTSPPFLTPAIATFFLHKSAQMLSILMRTLTAVSRMSARDRIVWLLLMLNERLNGASGRAEIDVPLNQSEIGDLIGLTNVSISKNLCQLSTEGFIERKGSRIVLRRRAEMQRLVGYAPMDFPSDILLRDPRPSLGAAVSTRVMQNKLDRLKGWDGG